MNEHKARETTPGTPDEQVSGAETAGGQPEQASPEKAGKIVIDPTREYQFVEGDDQASVLGTELRTLVGQAAQARQYQSQADTANVQIEQLQTSLEAEQEKSAGIEQVLAQLQQRQQIEESIRAKMPPVSGQPDEQLWSAGEPPTPLDSNAVAQQITDVTKQAVDEATEQNFGNMEEIVANVVANVMNKQNEQRTMQERADKWQQDTFATSVDDYMSNYGMNQQEAERIAKLYDEATRHEYGGRDAIAAQNTDLAVAHYTEAKKLRTAATGTLAKSLVEHQAAQEQAELEQQLESGQFNGLPEIKTEEVDFTKPNKWWDPNNRLGFKQSRQAKKDNIVAQADARDRAMDALNVRESP